jgi:hypothetical protein
MANYLGVTHLQGKRLDLRPKEAGGQRVALDLAVSREPYLSQNEPSIAVNPFDENVVLIFGVDEDTFPPGLVHCRIYMSFDGGVSYPYRDDVPLLNPDDICANPVARFTPNGGRVIYSYLSIRSDFSSADVVVTTGWGDDPGPTFVSGPTVVIAGLGDMVDASSLGVHTFDMIDGVADAEWNAYVVATIFHSGGGCSIAINRSSSSGISWDFGSGLLINGGGCDTYFLHGARVAGGPGQQVLVCYFNSEADGYAPDQNWASPSNKFDITCQSSSDRFDSFSAPFTAADNAVYELPYWLGPNQGYHQWFTGMFPSVEIDHRGVAHVAFAVDPNSNKNDAESGNVQYIRSTASATNPPYTTWTARATIGSGSLAQGFPIVVAQYSISQDLPNIFIAYYDHYRSLATSPNNAYHVRFRKSINGGGSFAGPVTVTEAASFSDFLYIGDYFGAATSMRWLFLAWTDRADKRSQLDYEDDIFTDRY